MTTSQILARAADHMEASLWIRGEYDGETRGKKHSHCIWGSIACVGSEVRVTMDEARSVRDALKSITRRDPTNWNDYVAKNKRQVVSVLRKASKLEDA